MLNKYTVGRFCENIIQPWIMDFIPGNFGHNGQDAAWHNYTHSIQFNDANQPTTYFWTGCEAKVLTTKPTTPTTIFTISRIIFCKSDVVSACHTTSCERDTKEAILDKTKGHGSSVV